MKFGIAVIRIQGHSMKFIDNLNFLVHEIRIFLVVSVIWALVADNDTLSYFSRCMIYQIKLTRLLQIMSFPNATGTKRKISLCWLSSEALRLPSLFGFQAPLWSLNLTMLDNPRMFLNFLQRNSFFRIEDQKLTKGLAEAPRSSIK